MHTPQKLEEKFHFAYPQYHRLNETTDIDMSALTTGIYLVKYINANRTQMLKISKQ